MWGHGRVVGTQRGHRDPPHLSAAPSGAAGPGLLGLSPAEDPEKLLVLERGGRGGFSSSPSARQRGGHGGATRDPPPTGTSASRLTRIIPVLRALLLLVPLDGEEQGAHQALVGLQVQRDQLAQRLEAPHLHALRRLQGGTKLSPPCWGGTARHGSRPTATSLPARASSFLSARSTKGLLLLREYPAARPAAAHG